MMAEVGLVYRVPLLEDRRSSLLCVLELAFQVIIDRPILDVE